MSIAASAAAAAPRPRVVLALSARSEPALRALAAAHAREIAPDAFADWCHATNTGRSHFAHRRAFVAADADELRAALAAYIETPQEAAPRRASPRALAWLYAGQGSQYLHMGRALYRDEAVFRAAVDECAARFEREFERPLLDALYPVDDEAIDQGAQAELLAQTHYTQAALFAIQYGLSSLWRQWGVAPSAVLGHSLGEYAAACAAGVLRWQDGLELVAARAKLMQALPAGGGMLAIAAAATAVEELLPSTLSIAAVNGPASTVVAGDEAALAAFEAACRARGWAGTRLQVSHAFHSPAMRALRADFARLARGIAHAPPQLPIVSSLLGALAGPSTFDADYWVEQMCRPVQYAAGVASLAALGCEVFLEIGPQATALAMARSCVDSASVWLPSLRAARRGAAPGSEDWPTMTASLATLYEAGQAIDWRAYAGGPDHRPARTLPLPAYPFARERYWLAPRAPAAAPTPPPSSLPGRLLPLGGSRLHCFEAELVAATWAGHRVLGGVLWPAAAQLALICAAHAELAGDAAGCRIDELELQRGLWLDEDAPTSLQTQLVRDDAADGYGFEILSGAEAQWIRHSKGRVTSSRDEPHAATAVREQGERLEVEACYSAYARLGIDYGPAFRRLEALWLDGDAALARLHPPAAATLLEPFFEGACWLDAGLQLAGVLIGDAAGLQLPLALARFERHAAASQASARWVQARRRDDGDFDLRWLSADGALLAAAQGLRLGRAQGERPARAPDSLFHRIEWQRSRLVGQTAGVTPPAQIAAAAEDSLAADLAGADALAYRRALPLLDRLAVAEMERALRVLDIGLDIRHDDDPEALAAGGRIAAAQTPLLARCAALLRAARARGDAQASTAALAGEIARACPQAATELALIERVGRALPEILQGRVDPLSVLFPGGDASLLAALYADSPGARVMNRAFARAVLAAVDPALDRPLRVLEIGAGTGGTTAPVLQALAAAGIEFDYCCTDVSPHLVGIARERLPALPGLRHAVLDIESAPRAQGLTGDFDLVLAANVLHATQDLAAALRHARELLAPDGALLLLEGTQPLAWLDLVFGVTAGWWKCREGADRREHPLLGAAQWRQALEDAGFVATAGAGAESDLAQAVLVARAPAATRRWLLVGAARELATALAAQGDTVRECASVEDIASAASDGVVLVLPETDTQVAETAAAHCRLVLEAIQRLNAAASTARLYVLSRRDTPRERLTEAALWGLLQTARLEHTELRCTHLCAPRLQDALAELVADDPETEVRYDAAGERSVARFLPLHEDSVAAPRLVTAAGGGLAGLRWRPVARRAPGAQEVELRVTATGLNFRDLLIALDAYPEAASLGCECVGEIVRRGEAVSDLEVGTRVMAFAEHAFGDYVCVPRALVCPVPTMRSMQLGDAAAASLPVAFATAAHALLGLARLARGEHVLIHAATGGVGQAALQIARAVGAEIHATASAAKWPALQALGVAAPLDSRSLSFADEILARTEGRGVDVVLNCLAGEARARSLAVLARGGRFVEIGKGPGLSPAEARAQRPDVAFHLLDLAALCRDEPALAQNLLRSVAARVEAGEWRPLPLREFARSDTLEAFRTMQRARHVGKLVIEGAGEHVLTPAPPALSAEAWYLVTGGLGGLGLAVADWLIAHGARRLVLLGRHGATTPAQHARLEAWQRAGVRVELRAADVADRAALAKALDDFLVSSPAAAKSSQLPLRGVVHAAGVLEDGLLAQQTWPAFSRVLAPKLAGAWHLHELTRGQPLDFFLLFSSAAASLGSPGQANHAAASAFLDGLAAYRRAEGLPAQSIAWGPWAAIGAAVDYARSGALERLPGVGILSPEEGLAALERCWSTATPSICVLPLQWAALATTPQLRERPFFAAITAVGAEVERDDGEAADAAVQPGFRARLAAVSPEEARALLEAQVTLRLRRVLGMGEGGELDRHAGFFELGLDSLTALELKNVLQRELEITLPATLVFDYPTVDALLDYLAAQVLPAATTLAVAEEPPPAELGEDALAAQLDSKLAELDRLFGTAPSA